jgi:hypothetical protein
MMEDGLGSVRPMGANDFRVGTLDLRHRRATPAPTKFCRASRSKAVMPEDGDLRSRLAGYLPELGFTLLAVTFMGLWVYHSYSIWQIRPASDWNGSEWMISYSGGFVRRGLAGSLLMALVRHTGWSLFAIWTVGVSTLCLTLSGWFLATIARLRGPAVWRTALLLNPLLVLPFAEAGVFLRKDLIFPAATILHVFLAERFLRSGSSRRTVLFVSALACLSTVLALLHEGLFAFAWLPLNLTLAAWVLSRVIPRRSTVVLLLTAAFGVSLVVLGASAIWHGNASTVKAIYQAWRPFLPQGAGSGVVLPPALDVLQLGSGVAIRQSMMNVRYFPLFLLGYCIAGLLCVTAIRNLVPGSDPRRLWVLLIAPLVAALPLFYVGMDWGRWFYVLGTCSFPVMIKPTLLSYRSSPREAQIPTRVGRLLHRRIAAIAAQIERHPVPIMLCLLLCPIPPWPCVGGSLAFDPVILLLRLSAHSLAGH